MSTSFLPFSLTNFGWAFTLTRQSAGITLVKVSSDLPSPTSVPQFSVLSPVSIGIDSVSHFLLSAYMAFIPSSFLVLLLHNFDFLSVSFAGPSSATDVSALETPGLGLQTSLSRFILLSPFGLLS